MPTKATLHPSVARLAQALERVDAPASEIDQIVRDLTRATSLGIQASRLRKRAWERAYLFIRPAGDQILELLEARSQWFSARDLHDALPNLAHATCANTAGRLASSGLVATKKSAEGARLYASLAFARVEEMFETRERLSREGRRIMYPVSTLLRSA